MFCLPPHVCFRLSFVLSVPTALFLSVPGYHFVLCLHISVSICLWVSLCVLSVPTAPFLSVPGYLFCVLSVPTRLFPSDFCSACPYCSVSVCPWVSLCVLSVPTRLFPSVTGCCIVFCMSQKSVSVCLWKVCSSACWCSFGTSTKSLSV